MRGAERWNMLAPLALVGLLEGCAFHADAPGDTGGGFRDPIVSPDGGAPSTQQRPIYTTSDGGRGDLMSSGTGTGQGGPSADANCGASMYGLEMLPPDMLIVFDRSSSMNDQNNNTSCLGVTGCQSKWSQMTPALNQVVSQTARTVRWGLTYFPSGASFGGCTVDSTVSVAVGDNSAAAIMTSIAGTTPNGLTPTAAAITAAGNYLANVADPNPKYILLATDGQPNCATGGTLTDDTAGAVQAVTDVKSKGVGVFVVGISTSGTAADTVLNKLAVAGGYPVAGATSYYPVRNTAELVSALGMITSKIASGCSFPLGKVPPAPDNIGIYADGNKVARDASHANGWDYNAAMTSVTIYGPKCDDLMAGRIKTVQAFIGCGVDLIP